MTDQPCGHPATDIVSSGEGTAYCGTCQQSAFASCLQTYAHLDESIRETAAWLVRSGFPFDWKSAEGPPDWLLQAVIEEWSAHEGESFDDIAWSIEQDAGYTLSVVNQMREEAEGA